MSASCKALYLAHADWIQVIIPDGHPAVTMTRLSVADDGGITAIVRFPPGWRRPVTGHHSAIEEVVWLAGRFEMSGAVYRAGDHVWYPPGWTRRDSHTPSGALALAWFSAPSQWLPVLSRHAEAAGAGHRCAPWDELSTGATPLGVPGRILHDGPEHTTAIVDALPGGDPLPEGVKQLHVLDLATARYWRCEADAAVPEVGVGPVWIRLVPAGHSAVDNLARPLCG